METSIDADVYEPQEDSLLMQKHVKGLAEGIVLDMGTGSGILAIEAAKSKKVKKVYAVDISRKALKIAKTNAKTSGAKIEFHYSDLFSYFKNRKIGFDLIIFNPPYLPEEKEESEDGIKKAITGGRRGYELIERFLSEANTYLKENGKVLTIFSSITGVQRVEDIIAKYLFDFKKIEEQRFAFETLYVYLITKSETLKKLENLGIKNIARYARGKRGIIYVGNYVGNLKSRKVAIKVERADSKARDRIKNEIKHLKILNRKGIGPRLIFSNKKFFVSEFIDGTPIWNFFEVAHRKEILSVIKDIFQQLYLLDLMRLNKEEMHRPYKHIVVKRDMTPVLIDFERMHKSSSPKNITQFCQFLFSNYATALLSKKGIAIAKSADKKIEREKIKIILREYKKNCSEKNLDKIIEYVCC